MKKKITLILIIILAAIFIWAGIFFWQNLRGIWPAIAPSSQNISSLLPSTTPVATGSSITSQASGQNNTQYPLQLPPGFLISIFAKNLSDARVMIFDPLGSMWVSRPAQGVVTEVDIKNGQVVAQTDIFKNLNHPHGLALDPQNPLVLYIAESDKISRVSLYTSDVLHKIADLPNDGEHFTRTLIFGPDGKLYVSIGSSCNACVESDNRRAKIFSMNKDGSNFQEVAAGLRNAVFMATNPATNEIWATDMGRDYLGDNLPPDTIDIIKQGKNYGWPYCYGKQIQDLTFDSSAAAKQFCSQSEPSHIDLQAHSAPLGLAFFPAQGWPQEYQCNMLVAYHGSWNRSVPTGYKIVRFVLDQNGQYLSQSDFITGWLVNNQTALGRPVDILIQPDGRIYISDDKAGVIYLITHQ